MVHKLAMDHPERPQRNQRSPGSQSANFQLDVRFTPARFPGARRELQARPDLRDEQSNGSACRSARTDTDADANSNSDSNSDSNSNTNSDTYANTNPDANADSNSDASCRRFLFGAHRAGSKLLCLADRKRNVVFNQ